jgi:hypothetical protein
MPFPCDRHLPGADAAYFRAVDVDAPPATMFRWLCQLRAAPYSYDWVDNRGRRSPRELTPGLEQLEVGQTVMTIFALVEFEPGRQLTLLLRRARRPFGEVAVTYMVLPSREGHSRLVVKLLVRFPGGRYGAWVLRPLLPWGDLVMMRRQLLNLTALAEGRR